MAASLLADKMCKLGLYKDDPEFILVDVSWFAMYEFNRMLDMVNNEVAFTLPNIFESVSIHKLCLKTGYDAFFQSRLTNQLTVTPTNAPLKTSRNNLCVFIHS